MKQGILYFFIMATITVVIAFAADWGVRSTCEGRVISTFGFANKCIED